MPSDPETPCLPFPRPTYLTSTSGARVCRMMFKYVHRLTIFRASFIRLETRVKLDMEQSICYQNWHFRVTAQASLCSSVPGWQAWGTLWQLTSYSRGLQSWESWSPLMTFFAPEVVTSLPGLWNESTVSWKPRGAWKAAEPPGRAPSCPNTQTQLPPGGVRAHTFPLVITLA